MKKTVRLNGYPLYAFMPEWTFILCFWTVVLCFILGVSVWYYFPKYAAMRNKNG